MDVDMLKTWGSESDDDSSMDMMMQMEKFPELIYDHPFYNSNTLTLNNANPTTPLTSSNPPISSSNFANNIPMAAAPSICEKKSSSSSSSMAAMREMVFRMAVMQPIQIDPESIKPPKRRNVKISKDPQSVAARHRRERISEKIRTLQRLVPGGTKMDTASMLDEAVHYVKFLKKQVQTLEQTNSTSFNVVGFPAGSVVMSNANVNYYYNSHNNLLRGCQPCHMVAPSSKQMLS